jgi:hypothetical protein
LSGNSGATDLAIDLRSIEQSTNLERDDHQPTLEQHLLLLSPSLVPLMLPQPSDVGAQFGPPEARLYHI